MTLYRQLLIFTLILFLLLFTGTWLAKLNSTRGFLLAQLESHAQDTATSLGLSISPYIEENDLPTVETMFNAVFDRGYYSVVRLVDVEGKVVIDRSRDVAVDTVPGWFVGLIPLKTPIASSLVLSGWNQAGTVMVQSHPGYAYKTLWETAVNTSIWFGAMIILVVVVGGIGLRFLLKPLKKVEHQAETLCKKQYEIQTQLPRTRELRRVVEAMNKMTYKVKEMFDEQARVAERLRKNAYHDPLTGQGNRRYLEGQVASRLNSEEGPVGGAFFLVEVQGLQNVNREKGFEIGDELVRKVSAVLAESVEYVPLAALARLTGGNFGMLLPDISKGEAERVAENIMSELALLGNEGMTLSDEIAHLGGIVYDRPRELGHLLADADTALHEAQQKGSNKWAVITTAETPDGDPRGRKRWRDILQNALEEKNVFLYGQPVMAPGDNNRAIHLEVFSRITDESGQLLNAAMFIPLAERLNLVAALDRIVLEKVLKTCGSCKQPVELAVNLSPASLKKDDFRNWIIRELERNASKGPRIRFEFTEFSAVRNLKLIKDFGKELHRLGHGYGLDHFGQSFSNFGYLQSLRPDFVKIDRAYTDELQGRNSDSHFFISSLVGVAHSLDILVIAEGVEMVDQLKLLQELNLDGMQGYLLGRPEPLESGLRKL